MTDRYMTAARPVEAAVDTMRRAYPYIWYERGGWWFKIFGEVFGPFGSAAGAPNLDQIMVELRIELLPDGTVTNVTLLNNQADPYFRSLAEGAIRAVRQSSPLQRAGGFPWPTIKLRFRPSEIY